MYLRRNSVCSGKLSLYPRVQLALQPDNWAKREALLGVYTSDLNVVGLGYKHLYLLFLLQHSFIQAAKSVSILHNMIQEALIIMEEESTREDNEVISAVISGSIPLKENMSRNAR